MEGRQPSRLRAMQGLDAEGFLDKIVPLLFGTRYREANDKAMRAFARSRERRPPNARALALQWDAYDGFDSWDRLPKLEHATLCITGDEDELCDWRNSERLAQRIPRAQLVLVPGTGHSFHLEDADVVNRAVREFLLEA